MRKSNTSPKVMRKAIPKKRFRAPSTDDQLSEHLKQAEHHLIAAVSRKPFNGNPLVFKHSFSSGSEVDLVDQQYRERPERIENNSEYQTHPYDKVVRQPLRNIDSTRTPT